MPFDRLVDYSSNDEVSDVTATSPASFTVLAVVGNSQATTPNLPSLAGSASSSNANTLGCLPTLRHNFTGAPTPLQMHDYILWKRARGQYYTVTTLSAPWEQWAPLLNNADMETRTCHCSKSRIHKLMCGHVVSVPLKAEECATNCAGMQQALTQGQISQMQRIAAYSESVTHLTIKSLLQGGGAKNSAVAELMDKGFQCFKHQKERGDLIGSDFACEQCAYIGPRPTYPATYYAPMHVIIVIRDEKDQAVVDQINHGIRPESKKLHERRINGLQQHRGTRKRDGRASRGRGNRRGVISGRVTRDVAIDKARRDEKCRVIEQLNDDALLGDMFTLGADW